MGHVRYSRMESDRVYTVMPFINVSWSVKFRAFGVDIGHYSDSKHIPLPAILSLVGDLLSAHNIYSYNDHGVSVKVDLVKV